MCEIIPELLYLLKQRKLIPFVGAGFSEGCGCPSSQSLAHQLLRHYKLENLCEDDDVDLLRLAQYLYIVEGGDISTVLHQIRCILNEEAIDVTLSEPHKLLAQLGAPIIYTTNYDSLIERSFDHLSIPYHTIISTEDIIKSAGSSTTQIVKFHGSLEQDASIVITESDYYERLEFITPIDIKLRVDALGKSLLFMGYSFSDFNIRYLWFKLRNMMKGITENQVPRSYILVFKPDEITVTLLRQRGIVPIDLSLYKGQGKTEKLCSFLKELVPCQSDYGVFPPSIKKTSQQCCEVKMSSAIILQ